MILNSETKNEQFGCLEPSNNLKKEEERISPNVTYRIAMIAACPLPASRGTPIRIYRMAEALAQRGHQVDVFTYNIGDASDDHAFNFRRLPKVTSYGRKDPGPDFKKLLFLDPLLGLKVLRDTGKECYDVIHAHHFEGLLAGLPSKKLHRLPLIFDVHTLLGSELPSYSLGLPKGLLKAVGQLLDKSLTRYADHVICVSDEIKRSLREQTGMPEGRYSTIPNGAEDLFFSGGDEKSGKSNGLPPRLVYAGNLAPYQGIDLLLEAFARARQHRPDLRLQILTDACFNGYEGRAQSLGVREYIDFANPSFEQLPGLLSGAAVVANPRTECSGLPQKLVNYMACGCPIVSFEGSARHVQHGESGLVVKNGDVAAFSDAIVRLLNDYDFARTLGTSAQTYARTKLSWGYAASCIENVYARVETGGLHYHGSARSREEALEV